MSTINWPITNGTRLAGNRSRKSFTIDVETVEQVRKDLRGWNSGRALFVSDAGMTSEEIRTELARACGKYLLACRMSNVSEIKREVLTN